MVILMGYSRTFKKYVELGIDSGGVIFGLEQWNAISPGSVKRYTGRIDAGGNLLFEDDVIQSQINELYMTIRYGEYQAFCPEDEQPMSNQGFYVEAEGWKDMPLGDTREYAKLIRRGYEAEEIEGPETYPGQMNLQDVLREVENDTEECDVQED